MNEEELINKVLRELDINPEWHKKQELKKTYGSKFVNSVIKLSFQKGKLKAIEDELRFLREIEKGTSCIDTKMFLKLRIEQLQKEIGDNSQQPRMKQTRGGELKSDEGLHSTDNGSPADIVSKDFLGGYAEFWDNPEDNRWDKEYNPDLLPETLKNKEEKQDEDS